MLAPGTRHVDILEMEFWERFRSLEFGGRTLCIAGGIQQVGQYQALQYGRRVAGRSLPKACGGVFRQSSRYVESSAGR